MLRWLLIPLVVLTTAAVADEVFPVDQREPITVRVVEGKGGLPVAAAHVLIVGGYDQRDLKQQMWHEEQLTATDGTFRLSHQMSNLPWITVWVDHDDLCQRKPRDAAFSVELIRSAGVSTPNECGTATATLAPGLFTVFVKKPGKPMATPPVVVAPPKNLPKPEEIALEPPLAPIEIHRPEATEKAPADKKPAEIKPPAPSVQAPVVPPLTPASKPPARHNNRHAAAHRSGAKALGSKAKVADKSAPAEKNGKKVEAAAPAKPAEASNKTPANGKAVTAAPKTEENKVGEKKAAEKKSVEKKAEAKPTDTKKADAKKPGVDKSVAATAEKKTEATKDAKASARSGDASVIVVAHKHALVGDSKGRLSRLGGVPRRTIVPVALPIEDAPEDRVPEPRTPPSVHAISEETAQAMRENHAAIVADHAVLHTGRTGEEQPATHVYVSRKPRPAKTGDGKTGDEAKKPVADTGKPDVNKTDAGKTEATKAGNAVKPVAAKPSPAKPLVDKPAPKPTDKPKPEAGTKAGEPRTGTSTPPRE